MKSSIYKSIIILFLFLTNACIQNNGDIGPIFGIWHLQEIISSDNSYPQIKESKYLCFQNSIINFKIIDEINHSTMETYGEFYQQKDSLHITLKEGYNNLHLYFGFKSKKESFYIQDINSRRMVLRNDSITWILKKH